MKQSFRLMNWKLLSVIFLTLFIPILYRTIRIFVIGTLPDSNNYSIAANLQWINVIFEVLEEAFLLPLFFTLKNIMKKRNENNDNRNHKITWQFLIISLIYLVFIIFLTIFTKEISLLLSVNHLDNATITFIRAEFFARWFIMIGKIGAILLIIKNKWKELILLLFISTFLNILLDLFITSNNAFSLSKGILWVAYNQLITTGVMSLIYLLLIYRIYDFSFKDLKPKIFFSRIDWWQYFCSGLESFVRNAFFIWFVIKTINKLENQYNQGDFWVMNTFMWDWLLLPILALGQYLNRDQAFNSGNHNLKTRLIAPFTIIIIVVFLWLILIPTYEPFIRVVFNNKNSEVIAHLAMISLGFYIVQALNEPIDKILYGDGKAQLILIQSLIVNIVVYIPYYYLKTSMTIEDVAIMMGIAIALDSFITFFMFFIWFRKKINFKVSTNKKEISY